MTAPANIGIAPPDPGTFICEEILNELGLTVSEATEKAQFRLLEGLTIGPSDRHEDGAYIGASR